MADGLRTSRSPSGCIRKNPSSLAAPKRFFAVLGEFVRHLPKQADWHYAGADATLGDAATPIFWYRPQGSETYRVIYADLSVRDVAPEAVAPLRGSPSR